MQETMVPVLGGRRSVGWLRVPVPLPFEVDRGVDGYFVLDDGDGTDGPRYVALDRSDQLGRCDRRDRGGRIDGRSS